MLLAGLEGFQHDLGIILVSTGVSEIGMQCRDEQGSESRGTRASPDYAARLILFTFPVKLLYVNISLPISAEHRSESSGQMGESISFPRFRDATNSAEM